MKNELLFNQEDVRKRKREICLNTDDFDVFFMQFHRQISFLVFWTTNRPLSNSIS